MSTMVRARTQLAENPVFYSGVLFAIDGDPWLLSPIEKFMSTSFWNISSWQTRSPCSKNVRMMNTNMVGSRTWVEDRGQQRLIWSDRMGSLPAIQMLRLNSPGAVGM